MKVRVKELKVLILKNSSLNFDVVIVGFGPVGQFAANLLNQYNLKIAVIEKSKGICLKPKANVLDLSLIHI